MRSSTMKRESSDASESDLPEEKWLVAFRNPSSRKHPDGDVFVRQFYAPGYYEAYDTVISHAEKTGLEVMWFREKRTCEPFLNKTFPQLESICIYCNKKFNHLEPIPCSVRSCTRTFCSRECMTAHLAMKH
jgi:hypothetical protein